MICKYGHDTTKTCYDFCFYRDNGLCTLKDDDRCRQEEQFDEDTNELLEEMKNCKGYISVSKLTERFEEADKYFNHESWNLKQILSNINLFIPEYFEK